MMKQTLSALTLGIGLVALGQVSTATAEGPNFNGTWNVQLVTESGALCESSYSYALAIQDGQVRLASAGAGASITGQIGKDGAVGLTVQQGPASGSASGRLLSTSGSGTWKASSLCSGRWTAQRRSTVTAQAF